MEKIINELVEMANEGTKDVLISYKKDFSELTINFVEDEKLIPCEFIVGTLNLEVYNTYEDIKEEIDSMLED